MLLQRRWKQIKRRRKEHIHKILFATANTVSIASLLFALTASQTGTTFGHFTDTEETADGIGICSVFPDQVEQMLGQAVQHIRQSDGNYANISGFTASYEPVSEELDLSALSDEQLEQLADELSLKLITLSEALEGLAGPANANASAWETAQNELAAAAIVLNVLSSDIADVNLNCLVPEDAAALPDFMTTITHSQMASDAFQLQAQTIYERLSSSPVFTAAIQSNMDSKSDADKPLLSQASADARAGYQAAQASLNNASASYIHQREIVQSQLAQVNTELAARAKTKEEMENSQAADPEDEQTEGQEPVQEPVEESVEEPVQEPVQEPIQEPEKEPVSDEQTPDNAQQQIMEPSTSDSPINPNIEGGATNEITEINPE